MSGPVRIDQPAPPAVHNEHLQQERVAASARLQEAFVRAMTRNPGRDVAQRAQPQIPAHTAMAVMTNQNPDGHTPAIPTPPPMPEHELTSLLQRFCSGLYVGDNSPAMTPRVMLALEGVSPGASAEIVRDGAFLRVRLRGTSDEICQRMQSRRQMLVDALTVHGEQSSVTVEVIRDEGAGRGRAD